MNKNLKWIFSGIGATLIGLIISSSGGCSLLSGSGNPIVVVGTGNKIDNNNNVKQVTDANGKRIENDSNTIETLYGKISQLSVGLGSDKFKEILGTPIFRRNFKPIEGYQEALYLFPEFYVHTLESKESLIVYYAIVVRKTDFKPPLPIGREDGGSQGINIKTSRYFNLGEMTLADLEIPESYFGDEGAHDSYYTESHVYGRPGLSRTYFAGYSDSGYRTDYATNLVVAARKKDASKLKEYRKNYIPNAFGVLASEEEILKEYLKSHMIGVYPEDIVGKK